MSSKVLSMTGVKPDSYSFDAFPQYKVNPSLLKENDHPVVKDSQAASVSGAGSECTIEFTSPEQMGVIDDLRFNMTATTSGDETCTFKHPYLMFGTWEVYAEGVKIDELRDQNEIIARCSLFYRGLGKDIYSAQQRLTGAETGTSLSGIVITNGQTNYINISLLPLFPYIQGMRTDYVNKMRFRYTFAVDGGSAPTTGQFAISGSTDNAYALLSYANIKFQTLVYRVSDPRLIPAGNYKMVIDKFDVRPYSGAFNTADTDYFLIRTKNDFATRNKVKGMMLFFKNPDAITAYNDGDAGKIYSLPEHIGIEVRKDTNILFNYKLSSADLIKRRRYNWDVQMRKFGEAFPDSVQASSAYSNYLVPLCYIDLGENIELFDQHNDLITGVSSQTNYEVYVHCGSTGIDADNARLFACLHYIETVNVEKGQVIINQNP